MFIRIEIRDKFIRADVVASFVPLSIFPIFASNSSKKWL